MRAAGTVVSFEAAQFAVPFASFYSEYHTSTAAAALPVVSPSVNCTVVAKKVLVWHNPEDWNAAKTEHCD